LGKSVSGQRNLGVPRVALAAICCEICCEAGICSSVELEVMRTRVIRGARDAAIPFLALVGVLLVAWEGGRGEWRVPQSQPLYPLDWVAFFAVVITVEAAVLWSILRPRSYSRSWLRAIVAMLVSIGLGFCWSLLLDGGRVWDAHLRWLGISAVLFLLLGIVSIASVIAGRITNRSTRRAARAG
jgi:hypothetical protein